MSETSFFDTNVLLYMYDRRDESKRLRSADAFRTCLHANSLVISTQVIQEFYVSATKKLSLPSREARALVADLCELPVITIEVEQIRLALDMQSRFKVSFWDALILAASETAGARILFSEDFTHGRVYGRVKVINPFAVH